MIFFSLKFDSQNTFYLIVIGSQKCIFHALSVIVKMRGWPLANDNPEGSSSRGEIGIPVVG